MKSPPNIGKSKIFKDEDCYSPYVSPNAKKVKRIIASPDNYLQATIIEINEWFNYY